MATTWVLTKGMNTLRGEFNKLAPSRDTASDGSIGDLAHQNESASSHNPDKTGRAEWKDGDALNEVRAIDVDDDLRTPGLTMEIVVQHLVALGRAGKLAKWVRYLIYNRRIWSASDGWKTRTYTGPSAHTEHLHVTGAFTQTADNNTNGAVFEFERIPVALTTDDKNWLKATIDASNKAFVDDLLTVKIGDKANPERTVGDVIRDAAKLRGVLVGDAKDTANAALPATSPLAQVMAVPAKLKDIEVTLTALNNKP